MKKLVLMATLCGALVGCNNGGGVDKSVAVGDSVAVVEPMDAKWDTIDWDEKSMPIYVGVEREYGGKFIPSVKEDSAILTSVANMYKTFVSEKGRLAMKYEKYEDGAGAKFGDYVAYKWAKGFKYDVKGLSWKDKEAKYACGMGFNDEFLKNHELIEFDGYDFGDYGCWNCEPEMSKAVPESVKQRIQAKYKEQELARCFMQGKTKDGSVAIYTAQFASKELGNGKYTTLGLRVVMEGDSMYTVEEYSKGADGGCWHVNDECTYSLVELLAVTKGKDGIDLFYKEQAVECTRIWVSLLRGGTMIRKCLYDYKNILDFQPVIEREYVDLGLESGTLWATCNVGANSAEEIGNYYEWGSMNAKTEVSEDEGLFQGTMINKLQEKGVADENGNLTAEYDVATAKWGSEWRMPTLKEVKELAGLKSEEATVNGVRGRRFVGKNGNTLFFPFGGCIWEQRLSDKEDGHYWSSTAEDEFRDAGIAAFYLDVSSNGAYTNYRLRSFGFPVRAVRKK